MVRSVRITYIALGFLVLLVVLLVAREARTARGGLLTVSFLDIGQGDAIYIESPTGMQVLIDGGADREVLRQLGRVMPWYDRTIDVVVGTHPDSDHIAGLIEVLRRYRVSTIIQTSVRGDTPAWRSYLEEVDRERDSGARVVPAIRGTKVALGTGAYLEVLFPDRLVPGVETNTGCTVSRLIYSEISFMLPCDSPKAVETYLVSLGDVQSTVLKAGHHGSRTSSSRAFVAAVQPLYAVYSRGCDNAYGHPHEDTIETFSYFHIPTLDTCTDGTITFVTDGHKIARK